MFLPKSFEELVKNLSIFPGGGEKTAERYVYSLLDREGNLVGTGRERER